MKETVLLFYGALVALMWGCYPSGPEYAEDLDVVYTTFDEQYDFQSKSTYAMPDSILVEVDIDRNGDTTYVYMKDIFATPILNEIDDNMQAYGWMKVDITDEPDLLVLPAGTSSTTYYYSWWYDWWYDYWYWDWWGWYYPPYYTVSSYTTGSLILVMTDPNIGQDSPINQSPASWISVSNGILTYYYDISRVTDAIEQSFIQSPYLKIN